MAGFRRRNPTWLVRENFDMESTRHVIGMRVLDDQGARDGAFESSR